MDVHVVCGGTDKGERRNRNLKGKTRGLGEVGTLPPCRPVRPGKVSPGRG